MPSPIECNLYGYAKNNPLSFIDPSGLGALSWLADVATGVGGAAWDTATGAYAMVRHPVRTAEGVVHAATHPVQTATAAWDHGKATASAGASGDGGRHGRGSLLRVRCTDCEILPLYRPRRLLPRSRTA